MKILLIILLIIGLLKLVSLFILCCVEVYYHVKKVYIGIKKEYGIYKDSQWYIIPTISFSKVNNYFELMIYWLCFQYYSCYNIDKDDEEK